MSPVIRNSVGGDFLDVIFSVFSVPFVDSVFVFFLCEISALSASLRYPFLSFPLCRRPKCAAA